MANKRTDRRRRRPSPRCCRGRGENGELLDFRSPFHRVLHDALIRNLAGLGERIAWVVRANGYAIAENREVILAGVEAIARGIMAGAVPEAVRAIHALPLPDPDAPSLSACLERLLTRIARAYAEANAHKPPGSRWSEKPRERFTVNDLFEGFEEAAGEGIVRRDDPEPLRTLLEDELWNRLNRAVAEANRFSSRNRNEHLACVPAETRRLVALELGRIELTTTADTFVDSPREA